MTIAAALMGLLTGFLAWMGQSVLSEHITEDGDEAEISWKGFLLDAKKSGLTGIWSRHGRKDWPVLILFMLAGAFLTRGAWLRFSLSPGYLISLVLIFTLLFLSGVDFRRQVIPDALNLVVFLCGLTYNLLYRTSSPLQMLAGLGIAGGFLFILALLGGMGGGDIKLMAAAGVLLGPYRVVLALFLGFLAGSLVSLVLIALKKKGRKDMIAFGPYLSLGVILSFLFYEEILRWYLSVLL